MRHLSKKQCNQKYLLADFEKFDNVTSVKFANFGDMHILTNKAPEKYKYLDEGMIDEVV